MRLDGLLGKEQGLGDSPVRLAFYRELGDAQLARGERFGPAGRAAQARAGSQDLVARRRGDADSTDLGCDVVCALQRRAGLLALPRAAQRRAQVDEHARELERRWAVLEYGHRLALELEPAIVGCERRRPQRHPQAAWGAIGARALELLPGEGGCAIAVAECEQYGYRGGSPLQQRWAATAPPRVWTVALQQRRQRLLVPAESLEHGATPDEHLAGDDQIGVHRRLRVGDQRLELIVGRAAPQRTSQGDGDHRPGERLGTLHLSGQLDNGLDVGGSTLELPPSVARRRPHAGGSNYAHRRTVATGHVEGAAEQVLGLLQALGGLQGRA